MQKHAKRNQILYSSGRSLGIAKENNEKVKKKVEKKTWELFESYLRKISPTLLAELEQGNITSPLALSEQDVHIGYGFSGQSKLFYEHFTNGENRKALESLMSDFFKVSKATIDLKWIEEEEAKEKSFISKSELMRRQREKDLEKQRQQIKEHPVIREAERIFNVKVKKINLNEE